MRQASASSTMKSPMAMSTSGATVSAGTPPTVACSIVPSVSEPERRASTISARKRAGSERQAKVTSRDAPMPSKAEPVSSAAAVVKKRPSPKR